MIKLYSRRRRKTLSGVQINIYLLTILLDHPLFFLLSTRPIRELWQNFPIPRSPQSNFLPPPSSSFFSLRPSTSEHLRVYTHGFSEYTKRQLSPLPPARTREQRKARTGVDSFRPLTQANSFFGGAMMVSLGISRLPKAKVSIARAAPPAGAPRVHAGFARCSRTPRRRLAGALFGKRLFEPTRNCSPRQAPSAAASLFPCRGESTFYFKSSPAAPPFARCRVGKERTHS